jgi:hypothetical protein
MFFHIYQVLLKFTLSSSTSLSIKLYTHILIYFKGNLRYLFCMLSQKVGIQCSAKLGRRWLILRFRLPYQLSSYCDTPLLLHGVAWVAWSLLVCAKWFRKIGGWK